MPTDLRYPLGRFTRPATLSAAERATAIETIAAVPDELRRAVAGLSAKELEMPYRPGGWTVRQLVHHIADSHMNAYCRFKLALTEDQPLIKPYDEARWAELPDSAAVPATTSLDLIEALHVRWVALLRAMRDDDFSRTLMHPQSGVMRLDQMLALYAWHGPHHVAHVTGLREREGLGVTRS
jgi:uncharacterized damage-inducible protein DinB